MTSRWPVTIDSTQDLKLQFANWYSVSDFPGCRATFGATNVMLVISNCINNTYTMYMVPVKWDKISHKTNLDEL